MLLIGNKILVKLGKNGESRHENMLSCPVIKKVFWLFRTDLGVVQWLRVDVCDSLRQQSF